MSNAIQTESLRKVYRKGRSALVAVDNLSLTVSEGEIFGFIGPNGAGKSTTIKILVGLVHATAGRILIMGRSCREPEARRHVGYVPETAIYHDYMTVGELMRVHSRLADLPDAEGKSRCDRVLKTVRLDDRRTTLVRELSKGLQQRFGLAQALLASPSLLILDEPTSGLDPLSQREIREILLDLRRAGMTIFLSSHQLTDMEVLCDRVAILHQGKLLACSNLADLLDDQAQMDAILAGGVDLRERLNGCGLKPLPEGDTLRVRFPRSQINRLMKALDTQESALISLNPVRRRLEDAYFDLVAGTEVAS